MAAQQRPPNSSENYTSTQRGKRRLLDQVRDRIRSLHYSLRTEEAYVDWVRRYVLFHDKRHPAGMGAPELEAFLSHLAVHRQVSVSTQNQAKSALLFLYRGGVAHRVAVAGRHHQRQARPAVAGGADRKRSCGGASRMSGVHGVLARLLYGTGMRLMEGLRLRVKDVDFARGEIVVREGKGNKDRVTVLPDALVERLRAQMAHAKRLRDRDLEDGFGDVHLPGALARKYPHAAREWGWQYVFPSVRRSLDPRSGVERRHHLDEKGVQRAMKAAVRAAGVNKPATPHTLRHYVVRETMWGDLAEAAKSIGATDCAERNGRQPPYIVFDATSC